MGSVDFYRDLEAIEAFRDVADPARYVPLPDEWYVIITDVRDSTKAVEAGRYKEVNVLGAASIVTVLNACEDRDLPFVFGGDGATLLVTANEVDRATSALLGLAATAQRVFGMDLRVGVVPMRDIRAGGYEVSVAKFALSDTIRLAMFWGAGMGYAEKLVKSADTEAEYTLQPTGANSHPDVSGLECRWRPIATRNGRMVSIIVLARADDPADRAETYRRFLSELDLLAPDAQSVRPVTEERMQLAVETDDLEPEVKLRTGHSRGLQHGLQKMAARVENSVGRFLLTHGLKFAGFDGAIYRRALVANTDFRKFDDVLRMVLDLSARQQSTLIEILEAQREEGRIYYGVHEADAAMLTCLVFDREDDHLHFIDGADGGYALAAQQLKSQIREGL